MTRHRVGSIETGYVLFAPMGSRTTYLIDKCGRQVHTWKSNYPPGLSVYLLPNGHLLRTGITQDTFYVASGKGGIIEDYDWDGNLVWSYGIANDSLGQHHDIYPMENGNILVIAWHGIPESKATSNGRYKGTVGGPKLWSERILELQPTGINGAKVVWQWSLWDHIIQDADIGKPDFNNISAHPELMNVNFVPSAGPDWIHLNSVSYNKALDQVILSCHNNSEVWIIDHSTSIAEAASHFGGNSGKGGDILYRWGNPLAYNKGTKSNQKFFRQHNAYWIPNGYKDGGDIMVFNNGLGRTPSYSSVEIITPAVSSPGIYKPILPYGPANQKWIYKDSIPTNFYSPVISGAQRMPNGNTMICSGNPGKLFEINPKNTIVWEYMNPVSADDQILTDGESPSGNSVFRCIYYPDTFSGFTGKDLTPGGPVERNPYPYSCSLIPPDITPPAVSGYYPALNSKNNNINVQLQITFSENVLKGSSGMINIYENKSLKETFAVSDTRVLISNKTVNFIPSSNFAEGTRVSISMGKGSFKDSSGNESAVIDTSSWAFNMVGQVGIDLIRTDRLGSIYPNPTKRFIQIPYPYADPKVELINIEGKRMDYLIKDKTDHIIELDLLNLANGPYSVMINGHFYQTIIKE